MKRAQDRDPDLSVRAALSALERRFPASSAGGSYLEFIVRHEIEHEYAGSAARLSTHWYDSAEAFTGHDAFFPGGFQVIPDFLARGLRVEYGQVVKEIRWEKTPVEVFTGSGRVEADHLLVTLPLGVCIRSVRRRRCAMRDALAAPLRKRLFFAGEASSRDHFGTTHGAYLSGLLAAREILDL